MCYEDRWSVELVNDRGVRIRDFTWSPSGELALICYADSFVLVGSAAGNRLWSQNMEERQSCCGAWVPDERQVILGTATGTILVMSADTGTIQEQHTPWPDQAIKHLTWSPKRADGKSTLAVCFGTGTVYFMRTFDDPDPIVHHHTKFDGLIKIKFFMKKTLLILCSCKNGMELKW